MVGYEKDVHLNKKKKWINKTIQDVRRKPQRRDKKPQFEQEHNILAWLSLYNVWERDQFTMKLSFFPINSLLSSQNIQLDSCPNNRATCSFYTLRNMVEHKDRC